MKKSGITFRRVYFIYVLVLAIAATAAIVYVNTILHQYEDVRPERHVEEALDELVKEALDGTLFQTYALPAVKESSYEKHLDIKKEYLKLYTDDNVEYSQKNGAHAEDELYYQIKNDDRVLAEIKLKATSQTVTKLAVLSLRNWEVSYVQPIFYPQEYTASVPQDFVVCVNGTKLTQNDGIMSGDGLITYTLKDLYFKPTVDIRDKEGNRVACVIDDNKLKAEFYYYTLTLPTALQVKLNGIACPGTAVGNDRMRYDIRELKKPDVIICDYYGNEFTYTGGREIPLTFMKVTADSRYAIAIDGQPISEEAITAYDNKEYNQLADYVEELPQINTYDIAILKKDAELTVANEKGMSVSVEQGKTVYDFTSQVSALDEVPEEVSAEIDVLKVAQNWSLFMSNDASFAEVKKYFIKDSYQYKAALQYATGADITFTSEHTLANPVFTDNEVSRFVWITDNCFTVDIRFVKHMVLRVGTKVDDPMNDRFYFVKYDDTDDHIDNPTWKITGMKEIVNNEK